MSTVLNLKNSTETVLIDAEDHKRVSSFSWYVDPFGYPYTVMKSVSPVDNRQVYTRVRLHRFIMKVHNTKYDPGSNQVDHINQDKLDCRKANLRLCSHTNNMQNRKKFSGVYKYPYKGIGRTPGGRWFAKIRANGKDYFTYLPPNATMEDAAKAYDAMARLRHGLYASLNFPSNNSIVNTPALAPPAPVKQTIKWKSLVFVD